ncbi:MAG: magnesium transporter [Thermoactinomyces sp.]
MSEQTTSNKEYKKLLTCLQTQNNQALREFVEELHSYDLANLFFRLSKIHRQRLLNFLEPQEIATLMEELELHEQKEVITALGPQKSAQVLNHMPNDDVADLLSGLEETETTALLGDMRKLEADKVRALLHYPGETAGGLMTNEFISILDHYSVEETIRILRKLAPSAETIYYLYVTDSSQRLVGVLSLRDLLIAQPDEKISNLMHERVISVPVDMDQEEVAKILSRYDFLAIPVVNQKNRLLGIVTVDDIIDVLIEEAQEDIQQLSALYPDKQLFVHPVRSAKKRIPWLIVLLAIGIITAQLISLFENTIHLLPVLTVFMPMIAGMTGNAATQSLATTIQGLSTDQLTPKNFGKAIRQEGITGTIVATVCSSAILIAIGFWKDFFLGLVIGISLFFTLILGTLVGTMIPILLEKIHIDPTTASGPLITTLNDVLSLMIYFGFATILVQLLQ